MKKIKGSHIVSEKTDLTFSASPATNIGHFSAKIDT